MKTYEAPIHFTYLAAVGRGQKALLAAPLLFPEEQFQDPERWKTLSCLELHL